MARFIEEFYYGNIDPQARSTKQNKTVQKQKERLSYQRSAMTLKCENLILAELYYFCRIAILFSIKFSRASFIASGI